MPCKINKTTRSQFNFNRNYTKNGDAPLLYTSVGLLHEFRSFPPEKERLASPNPAGKACFIPDHIWPKSKILCFKHDNSKREVLFSWLYTATMTL